MSLKSRFLSNIARAQLLTLLIFNNAFSDYKDRTSKTNINKQTDLFPSSVGDIKSLETGIEENKDKAIYNQEAMRNITCKSKGEVESSVNHLQNKDPRNLESQGRKELIKQNLLNDLYINEESPRAQLILKDAENIGKASGKLLNDVNAVLKDIGIDCKSAQGNKIAESEYRIRVQEEMIKNTSYNKTVCEEVKNKYSCFDKLTLKCLNTVKQLLDVQGKIIEFSGQEVRNKGWFKIMLPERGYHLAIMENNSYTKAQVREEIARRLGVELERIDENLDIVQYGPGQAYPVDTGYGATYFTPHFVFRTHPVHYRLKTFKNVCVNWQETWMETCILK